MKEQNTSNTLHANVKMVSTEDNFNDIMEMDQDMGMAMSNNFNELTTIRLKKKIEIVQQVTTILEKAMSSAKSGHQQHQSHYIARIDELQLQIEKLKCEMNENESKFKTVTAPLEDDLNKYMALDNILLTIEEGCKDDGKILLPDISKSDALMQKYPETDLNEWQSLKLQCQKLNYETQNAFSISPNICTKIFRVTVSKDLTAEEQYRKAMVMANALNMHRGKKYISSSPSSPLVRDIMLSWYKDQTAAAHYVQNHYTHVIQDVVGKEYIGRKIDITELPENGTNSNATIHVQAKATSANSISTMPQTITLYQFEETPYKSPEVTTFNVETASPIPNLQLHPNLSILDEFSHTIPGPSRSVQLAPSRNSMQSFRTPEKKRCKSVTGGDDAVSDASDILAIFGLDDGRQTSTLRATASSTTITSPTASSVSLPKENKSRDTTDRDSNRTSESGLREDEYLTMDGVRLHEWLCSFVTIKGIKSFTAIQKQLLKAFGASGDTHYKGVANGGKTTCTVLAILNSIKPLVKQTQVLIVTSSMRSAKWIQNTILYDNGASKIVCLRTDEVLPNPNKVISRPVCQILVGTCEHMKDIIAKNIINNERISHLVIDNAEDIFSVGLRPVLYKILYSLNATIKVTLISRTSCTAAAELEEFCKLKLRYTLTLEETVDIQKYLNQPKTKVMEKSIRGGSTDSNVGMLPLRDSCESDSNESVWSSTSATAGTSKDASKTDNSNKRPRSLSNVVDDPTDSEHSESDNESMGCRTFIPKSSATFLGVGIGETTAMTLQEDQQQPVTDHLYAKFEGDEYRVNIIAQLDIEEDKTIIFCNSIEKTEWLSTRLRQHKLWPHVLHQDVPRKDQIAILETFRQDVCRVLISTDFLTCISLDSANVVLNFDLPRTEMVYRNRTAFADRELMSPKKTEDSKTNAIVVSLIEETEYEKLMGFGESLGIVIESAYKDQDEDPSSSVA